MVSEHDRRNGEATEQLVALVLEKEQGVHVRKNARPGGDPAPDFELTWPDGAQEFAEIKYKNKASFTRMDGTWDYGIEPGNWSACKQASRRGSSVTIFVYDFSDDVLYSANVDALLEQGAVRPSKNPTVQATLMMRKSAFVVYDLGLKKRFTALRQKVR